MVDIRIKRWMVSHEQLPCLKKLSMYNCDVSEELPFDCLATSATLEEIGIYACPPTMENFGREIQEAQEKNGNLVKVLIIQTRSILNFWMEQKGRLRYEEVNHSNTAPGFIGRPSARCTQE